MNYKNNQNNTSGSKGIIIVIVLIILILAGIFIFGQPGTSNQNNQGGGASQLQASDKLYDFGTISMAKGNVEKMFKITNPTDKDIVIKDISTSCMCTNAYIVKEGLLRGPFGMPGHGGGIALKANETIKAGESMDLKVVYDPNAHGPSGVGLVDRLVYLIDATGGKIQLEIKAKVTP